MAEPPLAATHAKSTLAAILLLAALLNVLHITWGLPAERGWDIDSIAPYGPLSAASGFFLRLPTDFYVMYPLFHYMLSALAYAPYVVFLLLTDGLSLDAMNALPDHGLRDPLGSLSTLILVSRLLSAAMGVGIVATVYRIGARLFDRSSGLVAAYLTATGFTFLYYTHTANLDVPYLFWTMLALEQLVRIQTGALRRAHLLFGVFGALAIATKDQAYGFVLLPFLYLLIARLRACATPRACWRDAPLWGLLGGFAVAYVLASNLLFTPGFFIAHVQDVLFVSRYPAEHGFFAQRLQLLGQMWQGLVHGYGIGLLGVPLVLLGVLGAQREFRRLSLLLLAAASYVASFLFVVGYSFDRFVLGLVFILNIALGCTVARWLRATRSPKRRAVVAAAAALLLVSALHLPRLLANDSRYDVEQFMQRGVQPHERVWVYSQGREDFNPRMARTQPVHFEIADAAMPRGGVALPPEAADVVIVNVMHPPARAPEARIAAQLLRADSGFALVHEAKTRYFFAPDSLLFVNPHLYVFRRAQRSPQARRITPPASGAP